jgi:hypothetical protein
MNEAVSGRLLRFEWQLRECRRGRATVDRAVWGVLSEKMGRQARQERSPLLLRNGFGHTSSKAAGRQQRSAMDVNGMRSIMRCRVPESESGHEAERS